MKNFSFNNSIFSLREINGADFCPLVLCSNSSQNIFGFPNIKKVNSVKSELQIYNDFSSIALEWLSLYNFSDWKVCQWGQPSIQGLTSPLILIDFYNSRRYGWTSTVYQWNSESQTGEGIIYWNNEISISFTFWKDRQDMSNPKTNLNIYQTAYDVSNQFLAYLQSQYAREALFELGYWTENTPEIFNGIATDDSGKDSRFPVIRAKFITKESISIDESNNFITKEEQQESFKNNSNGIYPIT